MGGILNHRVRKIVLIGVLILAVYFSLTLLGYSADEARLLFIEWQKGKPMLLVKLRVHLPRINAGECFVAVHRFPSFFNPTETGYTERIYAGIAKPGDVIVAEKLLQAIPTRMVFERPGIERHIDYYEPQEFMVVVHCIKGGKTVLKWSRVVEVYPRKIVNSYDVEVPARRATSDANKPLRVNPGNFYCNIVIEEEGEDYERGFCNTWVKGPLLHSVGGLTTFFGICAGGVPGCGSASTGVYIESFADSAWCAPLSCDYDEPQWSSAGKKIVPSIVKKEVDGLTSVSGCESSVRLYFGVRYAYEYWTYTESFGGVEYRYWLLYPYYLWSVERADKLGVGYVQYTCPEPQHPSYAHSETSSNVAIVFGSYGARATDAVLARVYVKFTLSGMWSATLGVDFYKAGRHDSEYKTPYVRVANSDGPFYWWFKDSDPMSYEAIFSRS